MDIGNHIPHAAHQQRQVIQPPVDQAAQPKAHQADDQQNAEYPQQLGKQRPEIKLEFLDIGEVQLQRRIQAQKKAQRQG